MEARRKNEDKRKVLLADRKIRQEEILRKGQEKADRKIKQRMLEERWEMMRWITGYIDKNSEKWARQKLERQKDDQQWLKEWARMSRMEKIHQLRENQVKTGKKLTVSLKPPVLLTALATTPPPPTHQPGQSQSVAVTPPLPAAHQVQDPECGRAKSPPPTPQSGHCQSVAPSTSPAKPSHCQRVDDQPAKHDQPAPSNNAQTDRQPPTITGAVVRYVGVPLINNYVPILTNQNSGTSPSCVMISVPQPSQARPPTQDEADLGQDPECGSAQPPPPSLPNPAKLAPQSVAVTTPPPAAWQVEVPECGKAKSSPPTAQPGHCQSVAASTSPAKTSICQRVDDQPAKDDQPTPSHADNNAQPARQPPTITGAVVRYVGVHLINNYVPLLTTQYPGTSPSCVMISVPQPSQAGPPTQYEADQGQVPECGRAKSPPTPLSTPQYGHCQHVAVTPPRPDEGITPPPKPVTRQDKVPECGRAHPTTTRRQPSLCLSVATLPPPQQYQMPATTTTSTPTPPAEQVQAPECGRALPTTSRAQPSLCLSVASSPPPLPATYPTCPPQPPQPLKQEQSRVNGNPLSDQNMLHSDQVFPRKLSTPHTPKSQNKSTIDAPEVPTRTNILKRLFEKENKTPKILTRTPPTKRKVSQKLPRTNKPPHHPPTTLASLDQFSWKTSKPKIHREFFKIEGNLQLIEVHDFGQRISSRKNKIRSEKMPNNLTQKLEIAPPSPNTPRKKYLLARRKPKANPEPDFDKKEHHHHQQVLPHKPGHLPGQVHHLAEQERAETNRTTSPSQESTPSKKIKLGRGARDIKSLINMWGGERKA